MSERFGFRRRWSLGGFASARALLVFLALAWLAPRAEAATFVEQAERLELIYTFLLDFRPGRAPADPGEDAVELALEALPVPTIDNRVGAKDEPIDSPSVIPRFRVRRFYPSGFMVGVTYNPPVEVEGFEAEWKGVEIAYRFSLAALRAELRGYFMTAEIEGPITDPNSKDLFEFTTQGADLRFALPLAALKLYAGAGQGSAEATQTVVSDAARIDTSGGYSYLLGGVSLEGKAFTFTFEQSRSEDFLDHFILGISYRY